MASVSPRLSPPNRIFMMKQEELISSRLHHVDGQRVWGRFRLYEREIHLRCVGWRRVMYRRIPLTSVEEAQWRGDSRRSNLILWLTNGAKWVLGVNGAGLIKYALEGAKGGVFVEKGSRP